MHLKMWPDNRWRLNFPETVRKFFRRTQDFLQLIGPSMSLFLQHSLDHWCRCLSLIVLECFGPTFKYCWFLANSLIFLLKGWGWKCMNMWHLGLRARHFIVGICWNISLDCPSPTQMGPQKSICMVYVSSVCTVGFLGSCMFSCVACWKAKMRRVAKMPKRRNPRKGRQIGPAVPVSFVDSFGMLLDCAGPIFK